MLLDNKRQILFLSFNSHFGHLDLRVKVHGMLNFLCVIGYKISWNNLNEKKNIVLLIWCGCNFMDESINTIYENRDIMNSNDSRVYGKVNLNVLAKARLRVE